MRQRRAAVGGSAPVGAAALAEAVMAASGPPLQTLPRIECGPGQGCRGDGAIRGHWRDQIRNSVGQEDCTAGTTVQ
jgi:hypothetical protein